ncbi:hypothetical protein CPB83DRAFT_900489 [Crepidotus variabilis]|uniref:Uncharacterized protein n=1 Tax=Crepidotus variabilis TaxID=179855 RepID=A0A9P6E335_9AGAR|nr:hypothetical protein CPB83DRAFT_900489 [Crepidotus variabilis]
MPARSSDRVDKKNDQPKSHGTALVLPPCFTKCSGNPVAAETGSDEPDASPKKRTRTLKALPPSPDEAAVSFSDFAETPAPAVNNSLVPTDAPSEKNLTSKAAAYMETVKPEPKESKDLLATLDHAYKDGTITSTSRPKAKPHPIPTSNSLNTTTTPPASKSCAKKAAHTKMATTSKGKAPVKRLPVIELSDSEDELPIAPPSSDSFIDDAASDAGTLEEDQEEDVQMEGEKGDVDVASNALENKGNDSDGLSDGELEAEIERLRALKAAKKSKRADKVEEPSSTGQQTAVRDGTDRPIVAMLNSLSTSPNVEDKNSRAVAVRIDPRSPLQEHAESPASPIEDENDGNSDTEDFCVFKTAAGYELRKGCSFDPSIVTEFLDPDALGKYLSAECFNHVRPFANPARAGPLLFKVNDRKALVWANDGRPVVGLMPGGLTNTALVHGFSFPSKDRDPTVVKPIVIAPTEDHHDRFRAFVKTVFGKPILKTQLETDSDFAFSTKKNGAGASASPSKTKNSKFYSARRSKKLSTLSSKAWFDKVFPNCLNFEEIVPVYDARGKEGFKFDKDGLTSLINLLQYAPAGLRALFDLPDDAVVVVGYTMNLWAAPTSEVLNLLLNVLFVVLLGILME